MFFTLLASHDSASPVPTQDASVDFYGAAVKTNPSANVLPPASKIPSRIPSLVGRIGSEPSARNGVKSPANKAVCILERI